MLVLILAATASTSLPSEKELGVALAVSRACVDTDGYTNCPPGPTGVKFRQFLCVDYGSDKDNFPIVRCVYRGARMLMPKMRSGRPSVFIGDGSIDVVYDGDVWLPRN